MNLLSEITDQNLRHVLTYVSLGSDMAQYQLLPTVNWKQQLSKCTKRASTVMS